MILQSSFQGSQPSPSARWREERIWFAFRGYSQFSLQLQIARSYCGYDLNSKRTRPAIYPGCFARDFYRFELIALARGSMVETPSIQAGFANERARHKSAGTDTTRGRTCRKNLREKR